MPTMPAIGFLKIIHFYKGNQRNQNKGVYYNLPASNGWDLVIVGFKTDVVIYPIYHKYNISRTQTFHVKFIWTDVEYEIIIHRHPIWNYFVEMKKYF